MAYNRSNNWLVATLGLFSPPAVLHTFQEQYTQQNTCNSVASFEFLSLCTQGHRQTHSFWGTLNQPAGWTGTICSPNGVMSTGQWCDGGSWTSM